MKIARIASAVLSTVVAAGCANVPELVAPDVPPPLGVPSGQALFLEAQASGTQNYECASLPGQPGGFQWTQRGVVADLVDGAGRLDEAKLAAWTMPGAPW